MRSRGPSARTNRPQAAVDLPLPLPVWTISRPFSTVLAATSASCTALRLAIFALWRAVSSVSADMGGTMGVPDASLQGDPNRVARIPLTAFAANRIKRATVPLTGIKRERGSIRGCPRNCSRQADGQNTTGKPGRWPKARTREPGNLPSNAASEPSRGAQRGSRQRFRPVAGRMKVLRRRRHPFGSAIWSTRDDGGKRWLHLDGLACSRS